MHQRLRLGDLIAARRRAKAVALGAAQLCLSRCVRGVAEIDLIRFSRHRRACRARSLRVTCRAGRDVAAFSLRAGIVTLITSRVRARARRYRQRDAAIGCLVATGAVGALVARMIEAHAEALERRPRLQRAVFRLGGLVADRADRPAQRRELLRMAAGARTVAGPRRLRLAVVAAVAGRARQPRVRAARVREPRKVRLRILPARRRTGRRVRHLGFIADRRDRRVIRQRQHQHERDQRDDRKR